MNKKGAISLSINMLVIIVISLVIFGGGISLLYKLMEGAESAKATLDQKTESELRKLLEIEGQKVALPLHTAHLYPGDFHSFGLGILNIKEDETAFTLEISPPKAYDPQEKEIIPIENWKFLYLPETEPIKNNEYKLVPLGIEVPKNAQKGTYIFNVEVFDSLGEQYGNTKKIYVVVK